ncbi:MAG: hypothetical protein L0312_15915, partial [Acidobacteria bacterium]|nr:hypothetical protein [Acidobacteriota bacterium]
MHTPDDRDEKEGEAAGSPPPLPPQDSTGHSKTDHITGISAWLKLLKAWMATLVIPVPVTLGALVFTAFLLFPAYKGLTSSSTLRHLDQANQELQQKLDVSQTRVITLERKLAELELQLTQRQQQGRAVTGSGLYLSPLLYLGSKKSATPDLINIDFTQAEQAILVFSLPKVELQEVEISIYQETRLVWNQSIALPQQRLFNEDLVTLLLTRSALGRGNYRMTVQG